MSQRKGEIRLASDLSLPLNAVTETFAVLGIRGSGKTHTASILAEEMLKAGQPVVIYDPTGAWWGLKASASGKRQGYPVAVFGGEHKDLPLEETSGELIARVIVERRVPAILDVSLMRKGARIRLMTDFCEAIYHLNREPLHFIADEAHTIAPQRTFPEGAQLLGAIEDLVLQGRRRGLGCTLVSQRPALVNKNVLTQAGTLIAMRILGPQDREAVEAWIEAHGDRTQAKALLASLPSLATGEGWVWSPGWLQTLRRVRFRARETFDSSATPEVGKRVVAPQVTAVIDIDSLGAEILATVERAKEADPKVLRRRIADLERQMKARPQATKRVEVPVVSKDLVRQVDRIAALLGKHTEGLREALSHLEGVGGQLAAALVSTRAAVAMVTTGDRGVAQPGSAPALGAGGRRSGRPDQLILPVQIPAGPGPLAVGATLRKGERRMVEVLAQFDHLGGLTRDQLALLSGYTRSGTFDTYAGTIQRVGHAQSANGRLRITAQGRAYLGSDALPPPASTRELQELFNRRLRTGERVMLGILIDEYPRAVSRDDLARRSKYTRSGTFDTYVGTLVRNGLAVKESGALRASEALFIGGNESTTAR